MSSRKTTFEKLSDKIYKDTGFLISDFVRSYYKNRDAGEFSWFAKIVEYPQWFIEKHSMKPSAYEVIGSSMNATNCLKQSKLSIFVSELAHRDSIIEIT